MLLLLLLLLALLLVLPSIVKSKSKSRSMSKSSSKRTVACRLSKPEQKRLVADGVSHHFLIGRSNELIAQPQPAAQLLRRFCYGTRPALTGERSFDFRKRSILSER